MSVTIQIKHYLKFSRRNHSVNFLKHMGQNNYFNKSKKLLQIEAA